MNFFFNNYEIYYFFLFKFYNHFKEKYKKIFVLLILFIILNVLLSMYINEENEIIIAHNQKSYLKLNFIRKCNYYINICLKNKLIQKNIELIKEPKISIIMPIYNGGKYLFYSLRSIQNQNFKNIEILLIDDCSTDDSLNIIKQYMKEDIRIKLIKNKKNRKILYSKSIGALNSKSKYILELDQDDMFIRNDCFDILYLQAETNNLDLVQIRDYSKNTFDFSYITKINSIENHLIFPQITNYKNQPNLKLKMFINNNIYLLWGLLIKSDIYKKAIYNLWPIIMNYQLVFHEDYAISFMIIILSKRYKYLNKFGLLHLFHEKSASNKYQINKNYYLSVLFVSNNIYNYYIKNNEKDIIILINYIKLFIDCFQYAKKYYKEFYQHIIGYILRNHHLTEKEKENIIKIIEKKKKIDLNKYYSFKKYIGENENEFLSKKIKVEKNTVKDNYEISILIYCNEFKYLLKTIKSILNQKNVYFEIIIIYDNSYNKELSIIQKYIKHYKMISLIVNKIRKGLIFSISTGILKSKGNYFLFLQPTYILSKRNILNELHYKIVKTNLDILEFDLIKQNDIMNERSKNIYKCSHVKSNINLGSIKYNKFCNDIDQEKELLHNKLIKTGFFKNIINKYNINKYQEIVYNYFENIFLFCFSDNNANIRHFDIIGIIQFTNQTQNLKIVKFFNDNQQKINDSIFYINFLFDKTSNTFEGKKFALNELYNILSIIYNKFNKISNESKNLFEKFNNSKYINLTDKIDLNFYYKSLMN